MPLALLAQAPIDTPPLPRREMRAVWVATVSNIDWPRPATTVVATQQAQARTLLDRAVLAGANAIVLQIRSECDAMYPSTIEPWSRALTGQQGRLPATAWDPLQFWITEARARGMELHAWFNPYRAMTSTLATRASNHVSNDINFRVPTYGTARWLDPGHAASRTRFLQVLDDVVTRYDLDGVHIDDYFYPYPISGTPFPDSVTYSEYLAAAGQNAMELADWRRDRVNDLVRSMYVQTKNRKPWVKVGISPFGIWRPGNPAGVTGLDAFASLYADARKWMHEGWGDYFSPQLYWRITSTGQPYGALLDWWIAQNLRGRHVWPGNYTSNILPNEADWDPSEIVNQIGVTRTRAGSTGNVHFSAQVLTNDTKSIRTILGSGVYAEPALIPASPWLDAVPPMAPIPTLRTAGALTLTWADRAGNEPVRRWVVSARYGTRWTHRVVGPATLSAIYPLSNADGRADRFVVRAVDRGGNVSKAAGVVVPSRRR